MWCSILTLLFMVVPFSKMDVISNRYCTDLRPQSYVTIEQGTDNKVKVYLPKKKIFSFPKENSACPKSKISMVPKVLGCQEYSEQLLGMWYGVEIINHRSDEERRGIEYVHSCPIIHISEDHSSTPPPFYKGNNVLYPYETNYGKTNLDGRHQQRNDNNQGSYDSNYGENAPYGRTTYRGSTDYQGRKYSSDEYNHRRYADDIKRLRLLWTDTSGQVEYTARYNTSQPGFWITSGPQNGSSLEPQYNQFAGTIQVIKAVGNHLVLTICHQLPDQQLKTVILSRIPKLTRHELSDVHDLLTYRALETNNIKRVCVSNGSVRVDFSLFLLIVYTTTVAFFLKIV